MRLEDYGLIGDLASTLMVRHDYGTITPWVERSFDGTVAIAGPDAFRLSTPPLILASRALV